jgi:hypothetical protein
VEWAKGAEISSAERPLPDEIQKAARAETVVKDPLWSVEIERMRNARLAGSIALYVFFLAACSGNVFDLGIGDCFDDGEMSAGAGVEEIGDVPLVDCTEPHDNEVYEIQTVEGDGFPGDQQIADEADRICFDAFEGFVGLDYQSSSLDFGWLVPTAESWDAGDRLVACFVYRVDLEKVSGTLEGAGI